MKPRHGAYVLAAGVLSAALAGITDTERLKSAEPATTGKHGVIMPNPTTAAEWKDQILRAARSDGLPHTQDDFEAWLGAVVMPSLDAYAHQQVEEFARGIEWCESFHTLNPNNAVQYCPCCKVQRATPHLAGCLIAAAIQALKSTA